MFSIEMIQRVWSCAKQFDEALAQMREDGFLAEISSKYFKQDDTQLTEEIIAKNDALEAQRIKQHQLRQMKH